MAIQRIAERARAPKIIARTLNSVRQRPLEALATGLGLPLVMSARPSHAVRPVGKTCLARRVRGCMVFAKTTASPPPDGQGQSGCKFMDGINRLKHVSSFWDTPPRFVSVEMAGLLTRGSKLSRSFPGFRPVADLGSLAAYSCGGSLGIDPASGSHRIPLYPERRISFRNHRDDKTPLGCVCQVHSVAVRSVTLCGLVWKMLPHRGIMSQNLCKTGVNPHSWRQPVARTFLFLLGK